MNKVLAMLVIITTLVFGGIVGHAIGTAFSGAAAILLSSPIGLLIGVGGSLLAIRIWRG